MTNAILTAIQQICDEKGISKESVIETVESALAAAYRKDFGQKNQNIKVKFDPITGGSEVFDVKTVVEIATIEGKDGEEKIVVHKGKDADTKKDVDKEAKSNTDSEKQAIEEREKEEEKKEKKEDQEDVIKYNPRLHLTLDEARFFKPDAKIGDEIVIKLDVPAAYGRMAAQTAKQVIIQKLREVERDSIYQDFKTKEGEMVNGVIQRREARMVLVDLGRTTGILPVEEQVASDRYNPGTRMKFYIVSVNRTSKGPEIILSRAHEEIVRQLFSIEIPEIASGAVEIKSIAREAGSRSKIAVYTDQENIDPIGSCVGQRGTRVQSIINELGGEKIDIIEYDTEPARFIANALSPAHITRVDVNEKEKSAVAIVNNDQLSLAIGKSGQNVRLAAKLTNYRIDIQTEDGKTVESVDEKGQESKEETDKEKTDKSKISNDEQEHKENDTPKGKGEDGSKNKEHTEKEEDK